MLLADDAFLRDVTIFGVTDDTCRRGLVFPEATNAESCNWTHRSLGHRGCQGDRRLHRSLLHLSPPSWTPEEQMAESVSRSTQRRRQWQILTGSEEKANHLYTCTDKCGPVDLYSRASSAFPLYPMCPEKKSPYMFLKICSTKLGRFR